jgi:hypothetical protein
MSPSGEPSRAHQPLFFIIQYSSVYNFTYSCRILISGILNSYAPLELSQSVWLNKVDEFRP